MHQDDRAGGKDFFGTVVGAGSPSFNPAKPDCDVESAPAKTVMRVMVETMAKVVETKRPACDQGHQNYRIGRTGPGGGWVYEVSEVLGRRMWNEARKSAENHRGEGFSFLLPQPLHSLQRERSVLGNHFSREPILHQSPRRLQLVLVGTMLQPL